MQSPRRLSLIAVVSLSAAACSPVATEIPPSADAAATDGLATSVPTHSPTSEPTSAPAATPSLPVAWTEAASFDGEALNLTDLAYGSGRFVAVGSDQEGSGSRVRGRVWVSSVGSSWELLPVDPVFDLAYLTNVVTAADGRHLIFGRIEDASGGSEAIPHAVWESADGRSWRRIDLGLPADLGSIDVVVGPAGYLLSGVRFGAGLDQLWLSPDGRQWEQVRELPPRNGPFYEDIQRIAAGAEGFVAAGIRESAPYIIASADGREWFEAPDQPALHQIGAAPRIASLGGDWIIPGTTDEDGGVVIWFSENGLDWAMTATIASRDPGGSPSFAADLVNAGGHLFLTLASPAGHPAILPVGVWSSTDGRIWEPIDLSPEAFVYAAAASDDAVVLAGVAPAREQRATFWVQSAR